MFYAVLVLFIILIFIKLNYKELYQEASGAINYYKDILVRKDVVVRRNLNIEGNLKASNLTVGDVSIDRAKFDNLSKLPVHLKTRICLDDICLTKEDLELIIKLREKADEETEIYARVI